MESIRRQTFWQHIRHPFTIAPKTSLSVKERITAATLFLFGSLFALIGGPLLFYSYTYRLKTKHTKLLNARQTAPLRHIQINAQKIFKLPIQTMPTKANLIPQPPKPQPAPVAQPAPVPTPQPAALTKPATPPPAPAAPFGTSPNPVPNPVPLPVQPSPSAPPHAKPSVIDFAPLKLLSRKAQGHQLEKLYKSSQETLRCYDRGTPVSYPDLAKTKRDVDALEVALNELAVHWQQIIEEERDPKVRELARKAAEDESGLSAQLRRFIAAAKTDIVRFTNQKIDTKNLANEVAALKNMPRELQDYRLERILISQYRICKIKSDGNCGPRALAQGLGRGNEDTVRKEVTDYQLQNLDDPAQPYRCFYPGNAENSIKEMQKSGRYFTDMELFAFSELNKRHVCVLSIESIEVKNNRLQPANGYAWGEQFGGTPILLYHRPDHDNSGQQNQIELNHYDLLQPVSQVEARPHLRNMPRAVRPA
ncbi:MAG: hypothetical protein LLG04_01485 [Parachlamydia sp.]|nr:hypothetical protein [Parachlamydia sp.]